MGSADHFNPRYQYIQFRCCLFTSAPMLKAQARSIQIVKNNANSQSIHNHHHFPFHRTRTRLFPDNICIRPYVQYHNRKSPCCQWPFLAEAMTNTHSFEVKEQVPLSTSSSSFAIALENIPVRNILKQRPMTGAILQAVPFSLAF